MGLDIRIPIGLMFIVLGVLLAIFGLMLGGEATRIGVNIDLWWGLVLLGFGMIMFLFGRRGTSAMHSKAPEPPPETTRPHH